MGVWFFIAQILREMSKHKLRFVLAIFGVAWGTLTVVLLLAVGHGFHTASKRNLFNITENIFSVIPGETSKAYRGKPAGQAIHIRVNDIAFLKNIVPHVSEVSPVFIVNNAKLAFKNKQIQKNIFSIGPNFIRMRKLSIEYPGRFFNSLDLRDAQRSVVIGHKLKEELFLNTDALGQKILINNVTFTVIGVIQQFSKNVYNWYDNAALMPYTTYLAINGNSDVNVVVIAPEASASTDEVEQDVRNYFAYKFNFDRKDKNALKVFSAAKMMQFLTIFFLVIQIFLGICGALTLGAGCIGIANLMFLVVMERTREIGLRKALGARYIQILAQILLETLVLVFLGGVLGFVIADLIVLILHYIPLPDWLGLPVISWVNVVGIIAILALFGFGAGYFPARRAAKMDAIEAMNN